MFSCHYLIKMWLWNVTLGLCKKKTPSHNNQAHKHTQKNRKSDCCDLVIASSRLRRTLSFPESFYSVCTGLFLFVLIKPWTPWDHSRGYKAAGSWLPELSWAWLISTAHTKAKHSYYQTNRLQLCTQCCCVLTDNVSPNSGILCFCQCLSCQKCVIGFAQIKYNQNITQMNKIIILHYAYVGKRQLYGVKCYHPTAS